MKMGLAIVSGDKPSQSIVHQNMILYQSNMFEPTLNFNVPKTKWDGAHSFVSRINPFTHTDRLSVIQKQLME